MKRKKVIIIGGGAAGIFAAIEAAKQGAEVHLLERNDRLGKKLAITGKGRCNLTNIAELDDFIANIPGNGRFLFSALNAFSNNQTIDFFNQIGVPTKVERGGRVFPVSDRASNVVNALECCLRQYGVKIHFNVRAAKIITEGTKVTAVLTIDGQKYVGDAVVVAVGGASYPGTGSTGDGYRMARELGHRVIDVRPALVPLEITEEWVKELQGLSLRNVRLLVYSNHKKIGEEFGEMLFTHFGVSGPIVLTLSHLIVKELDQQKKVELSLNLKPALSKEQLDERLQRDFQQHIRKQFKNALDDLLPRKLIPVFIRLSGISPEKSVHQITKQERQLLVGLLTDLRFSVKQSRPLSEAIVTAGGIDVREINPKTMESKLYQGLFWAGEVLDINGYTGGYNLQAAFSTGYLAGKSAALNP